MRVIARTWSRLRLDWEMGLHRLPFFTQKVAVMLLGVLVATLALLGGVVSLVGPPGADGPTHLVPGSTGRPPVTTRPAPGQADGHGAGGGATAPGGAVAPAGGHAPVPAGEPTSRHAPAGSQATAGAAAGTPAAPPTTTTPTTTAGQGGLPPLGEVVSSVVSTLLP
ncbi:MAG TPA: hypothetical protein VFU54_07190 [Actinomycetota bacterium]|nr:hypothetical protein [Actinomycetota bacterium]